MSLRQFLDAPDARAAGLSGHLIGLAAGIAAVLIVVLPAAWGLRSLQAGAVPGAFMLLGLGTAGTLAGGLAVLVVARRQGRAWTALFGPGFGAGPVAMGFVIFGLIGILFFAGAITLDDQPPVWRVNAATLGYAAFGLVAMLAIAAAEEIVFRAYLPQGIRTRLPSGLATVVLTAVLFGILHGLGEGWPGVAYRVVLALAMFWAIAVTGNIGAAIGAHAANNLMALTIASVDQPVRVLALLELPGTEAALDIWSVLTFSLRCLVFIATLQLWQRHCHKKLEIARNRGYP